MVSRDRGRTWTDVTAEIEFPRDIRHGTVFEVDAGIAASLHRPGRFGQAAEPEKPADAVSDMTMLSLKMSAEKMNGLEAMLSVEEDMEVVAAVEGGDAAVAWCAKNVRNLPDVVVADVHMPKGDGFGMLAAMRNSYPGVRVLLLAGMPLKDEETRAREDGARVRARAPSRVAPLNMV